MDYFQGWRQPVVNIPYYSNLAPNLAIERVASRQAPTFLFVGSLDHRKGFDLLASAASSLLAEGCRCNFIIAGSGPLEAEALRLQERWPKAVRFVGFVEGNEILDIFASADVLVAPSRYDGWGLMVVEALAAALPVISTVQTGSARELHDRVPAAVLLLDRPNVQMLTDSLRSALTDFIRGVESAGEAGREAARLYDVSVGSAVLAEGIHRLCSGRSAASGDAAAHP